MCDVATPPTSNLSLSDACLWSVSLRGLTPLFGSSEEVDQNLGRGSDPETNYAQLCAECDTPAAKAALTRAPLAQAVDTSLRGLTPGRTL
jgi:hypothetical protein